MNPRILKSLLTAAAAICWLVLLAIHELQQVALVSPVFKSPVQVGGFWYKLALCGLFLSSTILSGKVFGNIEKLHVTTLLWRLFMVGMVGITVVMVITFANRALDDLTIYRYLTPVFFWLALLALMIFFLAAVFIFRRFILYPRTRRKLTGWKIFMGFLGLSMLYVFNETGTGIEWVVLASYIPFVILVLYLSANVRWIAYLNFNQKLRALGLFVLIIIVIVTYTITALNLPGLLGVGFLPISSLEFFLFIFLFTLIYSVFSILVLFFNLPTSSIFEMKSFEIASFNKINQAIQSNLDFTDIITTLLDASVMAGSAKAGWIEMIDEASGLSQIELRENISEREILELRSGMDTTAKVVEEQQFMYVRNTRKHKLLKNQSSKFKCLLAVPIISNSQTFGVVYVANELINSFEDVTVQSITAFSEQAGMALENARLVKNSIEMERYQEQLKIAQDVQSKLLPETLPFSDQVEFIALCENAYEVGGDYFDVVQPKEHIFRVAIGDVAGKGTTAAFYMAEIKGIFHALALLDLDVKTFITTANQALSECMQKGFFMTLTYLQIDVEKGELEMIRAGHCPAFYYRAATDEICMLREGTLGLGIVRSKSFTNYVSATQTISYQAGDLLVLYTDGIVEARNGAGEEFGYDRIKEVVSNYKQSNAKEIADTLVNKVKSFNQEEFKDDYTVLIIKFK